jgi:hypothetical protein
MIDNDAPLDLACGMHVLIAAFDDVPEHTFQVFTVEDGFITGVALTGPLAGEYGEPDNEMILRVIST